VPHQASAPPAPHWQQRNDESKWASHGQAVRLCPKAVITGVAFFDFQHRQTGVAPNAIELHPILAFRCLA
jgi:hypothetical protein